MSSQEREIKIKQIPPRMFKVYKEMAEKEKSGTVHSKKEKEEKEKKPK